MTRILTFFFCGHIDKKAVMTPSNARQVLILRKQQDMMFYRDDMNKPTGLNNDTVTYNKTSYQCFTKDGYEVRFFVDSQAVLTPIAEIRTFMQMVSLHKQDYLMEHYLYS